MTDAHGAPLSSESPLDADSDPDDLVQGADDLPDDVPNDDLAAGEPPGPGDDEDDTDVDAPVEGSPDDDVIHDEDEELDEPDV